MQAYASNSPRASLWEWTQTALLAANLGWTTLCLGGYLAETRVVTSALTGALLIIHLGQCASAGMSLRAVHPAGVWLLPFLVYAALNVVFVSPVPWLGWADWLGWAQMAAVFWVMLNGVRSTAPRRVLFFTLVLLGVVAVFLGCYQRFVRPDWLMLGRTQAPQFLSRASGPFGIPNSLAALLLLLLPVAGALAVRRGASAQERIGWGWVTLVFILGLILTVSRGAWLALAIALALWPLAQARWSRARRVLTVLGVSLALGCAGAVLIEISPLARDRLARLASDGGELSRPILWRAAWALFRAHPAWGSGAGSYNVRFEQHRPRGFLDEPQWAHNEYLNTLSDYGAVGLVALLGAAVALARRRRRGQEEKIVAGADGLAGRTTRTALGVGLLAFALQLGVDVHFKIPALGTAFAVVLALWLGHGDERRAHAVIGRPHLTSRLTWSALIVVVGWGTLWAVDSHRAEALRDRARRALDAPAADPVAGAEHAISIRRAEDDLRRASALFPRNAQVWSDLAFAHQRSAVGAPARNVELGFRSEAAARKALELSTVVWEFWVRLGIALDMQDRRREAGGAFARALELAPRHPHTWYYHAHHLSLDRLQQAAAREAIANCLALDPGNRAAVSLRETLNARR